MTELGLGVPRLGSNFDIYAFAATIALLTLYQLVQPTHTLPRLLSAVTLAAILIGTVFSG